MHTPGPWTLIHNPRENDLPDNAARRFHIYAKSPSGHTAGIADTAAYEWAGVSTIQHEANARLIVASPDLLEACKEADDFIAAQHCQVSTGECDSSDAADVLRKLEAAIAKAEGRET